MIGAQWALGVDIGGTRVSAAAVDAGGRVLALARGATRRHDGAHTVLGQVIALVREVSEQSGRPRPMGIGVGFGGPVDFQAQSIRRSHHVEGWDQVDLVAELGAAFGLPAVLENDANAAGLGEAHYGAGKGCGDVLYVNIGTGVGGAVVIDGRVRHGSHSNAGEFGHMVLDPEGPSCTCGKRGCVEALCSGDAIGRMGREAGLEAGTQGPVSGREVGRRAAEGRPDALAVIARSAGYMGQALAGAANLIDPSVIVLGGGVAEMGLTYLGPCREAFGRFAMETIAHDTPILAAQLGYDAGVVGAAAVIMTHQYPSEPNR